MHYCVFAAAFDHAAVAWRGDAIKGLRLPADSAAEVERAVRGRWPDVAAGEIAPDRGWHLVSDDNG